MRENMNQGPGPKKYHQKENKTLDQVQGACEESSRDSCAKSDSRNIWIVGGVVIVLVTIFCAALMNNQNNNPALLPISQIPAQVQGIGMDRLNGLGTPVQTNFGVQSFRGSQYPAAPFMPRGMGLPPRAFYGPNCPVYQNYVQPSLPNGQMQAESPWLSNDTIYPPIYPNQAQPLAQNMGMQPVAGTTNPHAGCPSFTQCFPQAAGGLQPVAFTNPHAGCPSFTQCFPQGSAQAVAMTNPVMGAAAAIAQAPPIFRDAVMPHTFRGVCENCHVVNPDIPITSKAQMPHEYRGVCSNCHKITDLPPPV